MIPVSGALARAFSMLAYGVLGAATIAAVAILLSPLTSIALPPAGTDVVRATGQVVVQSRLGEETIDVSGRVTIQRGTPYLDGGVEVVDMTITNLDLAGQSVTGPVGISNAPTSSTGELRSQLPPPDEYPADSFFDVFATVTVPASPSATFELHNAAALRLEAGATSEWPPYSLKYSTAPLKNFDNDGDTLIDEDTADEDGDGLIDEDRPGGDPVGTCGIDADCDGSDGEDPPFSLCAENNGGAGTACDADGDSLVDEDPECIPLLSGLGSHKPAGVCLVSLSIALQGDTDGDDCSDAQEDGLNEGLGGRRNPENPWDFYDVNGDYAVNIPDDILAVAAHFGPTTDPTYDRSRPPTAEEEPDPTLREPWDMGPPDGTVSIPVDILGAARQFAHTCV